MMILKNCIITLKIVMLGYDKMRTNNEKNAVETAIADAISNLCIPILKQYSDKIAGIYLSPFSIGENKKIQIVVVKNDYSELIIEKKTDIDKLHIFISEEIVQEYKVRPKTNSEYKLAKDLKTAVILYDVRGKLAIKKGMLNMNSEIVPFYNTFELSDSIKTMVKTKIRDYKKNGKN